MDPVAQECVVDLARSLLIKWPAARVQASFVGVIQVRWCSLCWIHVEDGEPQCSLGTCTPQLLSAFCCFNLWALGCWPTNAMICKHMAVWFDGLDSRLDRSDQIGSNQLDMWYVTCFTLWHEGISWVQCSLGSMQFGKKSNKGGKISALTSSSRFYDFSTRSLLSAQDSRVYYLEDLAKQCHWYV